jgi:hypothetical protein
MSTPPYWNHWLHDITQLMGFCAANSPKRCITGASRSLAGKLRHAAGQVCLRTIGIAVGVVQQYGSCRHQSSRSILALASWRRINLAGTPTAVAPTGTS